MSQQKGPAFQRVELGKRSRIVPAPICDSCGWCGFHGPKCPERKNGWVPL